jgi:hypothetical protein
VQGSAWEPTADGPLAPPAVSLLKGETRDVTGNAVVFGYLPEDGTGVDTTSAREQQRGPEDDPHRSANRYFKRTRYGNTRPLLDPAGRPLHHLTHQQIGCSRPSSSWLRSTICDHDTRRPCEAQTWEERQ